MPSITRRRSPNSGQPASSEVEILAATRRLLINGANFTEIGVQQISTEAGVARSTFYSHFRDKIDLLMRLAATMFDTSFHITSAWQPEDGVERLTDAFLQVLRAYRAQAPVLRAILEVASYDTNVRDFWNQGLTPFTDRTIAGLRDEQQAGRTPGDLDPVTATRVIVVGGERAILDQITVGDPADDPSFAREIALIWWYGAYRRPSD
ncbi:TetR/AcrR family transcriptional regulator [Micromonospora sp. NPDC050397]|uniref:TetR/AcrR family transcriptional regulator n=1 Tax=Micromonospora sp. NPDC050397 TaxID=3364279 RepID=UPI00384E3149